MRPRSFARPLSPRKSPVMDPFSGIEGRSVDCGSGRDEGTRKVSPPPGPYEARGVGRACVWGSPGKDRSSSVSRIAPLAERRRPRVVSYDSGRVDPLMTRIAGRALRAWFRDLRAMKETLRGGYRRLR